MTRKSIAAIAILAILLAGCGKDPISMAEANKIAAFSEDADMFQEQFAKAIQELSTKKGCQPSYMMHDEAGFWRVTGDNFYFIYCGEPMNVTRRWYYSPFTEKLSRIKAEM